MTTFRQPRLLADPVPNPPNRVGPNSGRTRFQPAPDAELEPGNRPGAAGPHPIPQTQEPR